MGINKAFVVKNGFEVSTDLIFANTDTRRVGIATTNINYTLHVNGGIGATNVYVTNIGTFADELNVGLGGTVLTVLGLSNSVGVGTALPTYLLDIRSPVSTGQTALYVQGDVKITGKLSVDNASTLGNVKISSGIITASSGIVTYYGDGAYLDLTANPTSGVGIGITSGVLGYGVTFINFYGTGVSTTFYNSSAGIATIFFEGGGSGSIGIGTEFPVFAESGDLFYSAEYARLFVYYDEVLLGVGSTAFWVDAAPFNIGVLDLTLANLTIANLIVTSNTNLNHLNVTGISTLNSLTVGNVNSSSVNVAGIVTATAFIGNGSGLTGVGAGLSVANDTSTNATFYPLLTQTTVGLASTGRVSTTKLSFNPSTGTLIAKAIEKVELKNYTETVSNVGNTGTTTTLNLENGNVFSATLTGNCTFTFTTGVTTGAASFTLILTNDATAGRSIVWPVSVKWPNASIPPRTTTANATDIWSFFTPDNGTTWYGNIALYNFT